MADKDRNYLLRLHDNRMTRSADPQISYLDRRVGEPQSE